ncbi:IS256 family transposase [Mesomycoplasma ovipneumoniae]|uniref:IS256 family transposase n=1 Tax=Mesomycoplasma ovipneumoniae TaxID=29562 RepID=UPI0028AB4DBA|nr:transposase [Mesomycoplasma ovipneumoniae]WNM13999.1 transposase [Mesomycoplasma ovipneumoniae]
MKKEQKNLSAVELETKKIASKYADYKKIKKEDFHNEISHIFKTFVEVLLNTELSQYLGYEKRDRSKKGVHRPNKRNGFSSKTVNYNSNNIRLKIPRDRNRTFKNKLIGKYEKSLGNIEEQVFSLFASGMSYENIVNTIKNIYKKEKNNDWISSVANKLLPEIEKWKSQKIDNSYPILHIDEMFFNIEENSVFVKKSLYVIFAIDSQDIKKILGFWIKNSESAINWVDVFSELKTRGLQDVSIISCDNLSEISQAIEALFPKNRCLKMCCSPKLETHFLKVSNKCKKELYLWYEKRFIKRIIKNLQCKILMNLRKSECKNILQLSSLGMQNFIELTTFFKYPYELSQAIYRQNLIESVKNKSGIQSANYLSKITNLTFQNASKKWQMQVRNCHIVKKTIWNYFP